MSRRFQIVLPDALADELCRLAEASDEAPSTFAAQLARSGVARAAQDRAAGRASGALGGGVQGTRPGWLEPYGGAPSWRQEMWGAIVALHGRYPRHLDALKDGWWLDDAHTEILGALAVWRAQIDDGAENPREELAFHTQLAGYASVLRQEAGGVEKAWKPGAPPDEWTGR